MKKACQAARTAAGVTGAIGCVAAAPVLIGTLGMASAVPYAILLGLYFVAAPLLAQVCKDPVVPSKPEPKWPK